MISILILTLNEELNLPACLESVKWSDDIVVFDSYSTDRTVEIAKNAGARIGRTSCVFQPVRDTAKSDKGASIKSLEG